MGDGLALLAIAIFTVGIEVSRWSTDRRLSRLRWQRRKSHRAQRDMMYAVGIEVGFVAHAVMEGESHVAIDVLRASAPKIERIGRDHGYVVTTLPTSDTSRTVVRLVKRRDTPCDA